MDFIQTAEIADAELDAVAGGLGHGELTSTVNGVVGTATETLGTVTGAATGNAGLAVQAGTDGVAVQGGGEFAAGL